MVAPLVVGPPPVNYYTMYSRLVRQDRNLQQNPPSPVTLAKKLTDGAILKSFRIYNALNLCNIVYSMTGCVISYRFLRGAAEKTAEEECFLAK